MAYSLSQLAEMAHGVTSGEDHQNIEHLVIDSRAIVFGAQSIFIALKGHMMDGHEFVKSAYESGVRCFMVERLPEHQEFQNASFLVVEDCKVSLQLLAVTHRSTFHNTKVIGITGSNGKTIVKEWLSGMLAKEHMVVKSPKSFNSQLGVPLSIWQMKERHEYAIFEAGISLPNEMNALEKMIKPNIGIFTNIGQAHDAGFESHHQKIREKALLFEHCEMIICRKDHEAVYSHLISVFGKNKVFSWGRGHGANLEVQEAVADNGKTILQLSHREEIHSITIPADDIASLENAMHCIAALRYLGYAFWRIEELIQDIGSIEMRLELKEGIDGSLIINDAYINDITSLDIALQFQQKHGANRQKVVILSEMAETGMTEDQMHISIEKLLQQYQPDKILLVGPKLSKITVADAACQYYSTTKDLIAQLMHQKFINDIILIKGSRKHQFEELEKTLLRQSHSTTLSIDLGALEHNLATYASYLTANASLICVIKAGAYGSGSEEIAKALQYKGVDYLAVAFADEGVQLRKAGISMPIMVLNPDDGSLEDMCKYQLEPEVYDIHQLNSILKFLTESNQILSIHLKLDTGMSRLGFREEHLNEIIHILIENKSVTIASIFSHLASSEDVNDDDFTHKQVNVFAAMYHEICERLTIQPKRHILNSAGIHRFPQYHFDYVRLGLGLYGLDPNTEVASKLEKVHTLSARIIQIKTIQAGESVGYNRTLVVDKATIIAVLNIGYADGLFRASGNGRYSVQINGRDAKIIGNVCMDLTIVDVSHIHEIKTGDEAIIFGPKKPIELLAKACNTISYEILTRISPRIKRRFIT